MVFAHAWPSGRMLSVFEPLADGPMILEVRASLLRTAFVSLAPCWPASCTFNHALARMILNLQQSPWAQPDDFWFL